MSNNEADLGTPTPDATTTPAKTQVSRRTVATAAAWTVPAISAAAAAPFVSASPCTPQTFRVDPEVLTAGTPANPETYKTTPLVITIPGHDSPCPITFTIRGGDGSLSGGAGITATGTIVRSDNTKPLTMTLIAGAHGNFANPANSANNNTGGPGYGKGGEGSWLSYGQYGAGNGHMHASAGGGGGGSAILIGTATSTSQSSTSPLVVAGGGGGGSAWWRQGVADVQVIGSERAGVPMPPGVASSAAWGQSITPDGTPDRPFGRVHIGNLSTGANVAAVGYGLGEGSTAASPALAASGPNGGNGAKVSTSTMSSAASYGSSFTGNLEGTMTNGVWVFTRGTGTIVSQWVWNQPGGKGGDHGTGMYGGGNSGLGNTTPPTNFPNSGQEYTAGGNGGGGYAGGGGGLSFCADIASNLGSARMSTGSSGAAGSSFQAASVANPSGGTVTLSGVTWTPDTTPTQHGSTWPPLVHGFVEITVG